MNLGYSVASAAAVLALGLFAVRRRSNPYIVVATLVPLALLPMLASSAVAVATVIEGFRQMALTQTGGVEVVTNVLLSANDIALTGEVASIGALLLLVLLALSATRLLTPVTTATNAATFHSKLISGIAVMSVLASLSIGAYLQRSLSLPLAVVAPARMLEDPNAPRTMRAAQALDLLSPDSEASIGTVSKTIGSRLARAAMLTVLTISLTTLGFIIGTVVSFLGPTFSRSTAVAGALLAGIGLLMNAALVVGHRGYAAEIDYIRTQYAELTASPNER